MGKIGLVFSSKSRRNLCNRIRSSDCAVYKSTNKTAKWTKMSDAAGGTGPHYYQELYVST